VIDSRNPAEILEQESLYDLAGWRDYFKRKRAVLLVIDPQNDVLDEKGNLGFWQVWKHAQQNNAIENVKRMIAGCREMGIPVIWAVQYRLAGGKDIFPGTFDGDMLSLIRTLIPDAFLQDSWQTAIYDELREHLMPHDIVIGKHGSSMFEGTTIEKYLKNLGAEVLLVTGFLTDFCVEATVRSACDRGYLAVTISDACATENEEIHRKALGRLERLIGPVISTDEMLNLLREYQVPPLPKTVREFDVETIGTKMSNGFTLHDIVDWKRYVRVDKTALLVIDPQNDNLHEKGSLNFIGSWKHARDTGAVENVKRLVQACREQNIRVFWIKQNRLPQGKDIFPGSFDARMMELIHGVIPEAFYGDIWDTDIYDELKSFIRDDEILIEKPGWNAFEGTPLGRYLNAIGITTLLVCGFLTDFCVESTVRSASDRGFLTMVAADACASSSQEDHDMALARFDRLIGPVLTTDKLITFMGELAGEG
jgi:nicotinamidase-related amidase